MKKIHWVMRSVFIIVLAMALDFAPLSSNAVAEGSEEVVILVCTLDTLFFPSPIILSATNSSANAPLITPGTGCAQAIADLLRANFKIKDVQPAGFGGGAFYTLIKG